MPGEVLAHQPGQNFVRVTVTYSATLAECAPANRARSTRELPPFQGVIPSATGLDRCSRPQALSHIYRPAGLHTPQGAHSLSCASYSTYA